MPLLRELGDPAGYPLVDQLGLDPADAGRLDVAILADHTGFYRNAETGEERLLDAGAATPPGIWIAQRDLDGIKPAGREVRDEPHGFGEGFGSQADQRGGDTSYPEEDSGGTIRPPDPRAGESPPSE